MKILAIRGKNLASLAGEFVLDFQSEPLASAGLFAITGATGSGKSTLLDALCLALYEQTPRLSGVSGSAAIADVGNNAITPGDVRTILRRGCSDGYAEVDFVASTGMSYRARWAVRRAHGKASGKLQQTEISLTRISDGQALGEHRKTETLKLIESFVGLSFTQFTRAVLLAQNDFTAFLKAPDDARAELLQTLTGTESYAKISILAFERMKTEQEKLAQLQAQWQALAPLPPELRAEKAAQLQVQMHQADALARQKSAIEGHLRWHQLGDQLNDEVATARQILATALATNNAAAARTVHLALIDQLQSARPLGAELARLNQAEANAAGANDLAQTALVLAQAQLETLALKQLDAQLQCNIAEAARTSAQTDIDAAKAWDTRINTLTPLVTAALHEYQRATAQRQLELDQQSAAIASRQSDHAQLAAAQQWLEINDALRPLAESWQRWEILFAGAQQIVDRQASAATRIAALTQEIAAFELNLSRASETKTQAEQALQQALTQLAQISGDCAAFDVEQWGAERAALELSQTQRQISLILCEKLINIKCLQQQQSQQLQHHSESLNKYADALRANLQDQPLLQCALQTAQESLQLATLAASKNAESMRAALQPEQPCPVCGARAHPYAAHSPAFAMLKSLREHLSAKQSALRELELGIATAQANSANAEQAITQLRLSLSQLEAERGVLNREWRHQPLQQEIDALPESARVQTLTAQQNAVRLELARLGEQEALYRDARKRKDAAQVQANTSNTGLTKASAVFAELASQHAEANQNLNSVQRELAELTEQLAAGQNQLDAAFPSPLWRDQWRQNPYNFVSQRRTNVATWAAQLADVAALSMRIAQLEIAISACEKSCLHATTHSENQRDKHAELTLALHNYHQQRAALFDGQSVVHVEAKLNAALLQTKTVLAAAGLLLHAAQAEFARTHEAFSQAEIRLDLERSAAKVAQLNLDAWLRKFNAENAAGAETLTPHALGALLTIAPEWATHERAALQELTRAVQAAQAVLDARSQSLSAHAASQIAVEAREDLHLSLAQRQLDYSALNEALTKLKLEIALDAARVCQSDALAIKIEAQSNDTYVWSQLGELIGSADGKKFRNFAQQLTLDILLRYANQHLQNLTRRYRVERIKDSLGLLVLDQDMGDEMRSVHTLSGGESFLLSLALALGLASLSSHRVQVESLFIDEGFGSLDAESLGVAMDALDNLQSQGRKIGVISHLQELTERVSVKVQVQRQIGGVSKLSFATAI